MLNLIAVLDLDKPLDEALAQPRIHQQWQPDQLRIEKALPEDIRAALKERGHEFFEETTFGASQAVGRSADGKGFVGASDPRTSGKPAGF